jgi:hypothetical protein
MRTIFISYRREDSEGQAGRIHDDLAPEFGEDAVFMDVADIAPGRDFRGAIEESVSSCSVLLAVIGRNWVTAKNDTGQRRLDDPTDFVRIETAAALRRGIPVVPVLVQGASMPRAEEFPEDLRDLAFRNSIQLSHVHWDSDIQVLVKALRRHLGDDQEQGKAVTASWNRRKVSCAVTVALVAVVGVGTPLLLRNLQPAMNSGSPPVAIAIATPTTASERPPDQMASPPAIASPIPTTEPTANATAPDVIRGWLYVGHRSRKGWLEGPYLDAGDQLPVPGTLYTTTAKANVRAAKPAPPSYRLAPVLASLAKGRRVMVSEVAPSVGAGKVWVRVQTLPPR